MKKQREILILIVLLVFGVSVMAQDPPPFPDEPPWFISIEGLDSFSLIGVTPMGTYAGSDIFTVGVNWPSGAVVSGDISTFSPSLTNAAIAAVVPENVPQGITDCTVSVQVDIILLDAPGTYGATLTITVTNNP